MHINSNNSYILIGICALLISDVLLHIKAAIEKEFQLIRFHSMSEYGQLIFYKTYKSFLSTHVLVNLIKVAQ